LLPLHQPDPNGRTWQEAAATVVDKTSGMMTLGTFISEAFPEDQRDEFDFFAGPNSTRIRDHHGRGADRRLADGQGPKNGGSRQGAPLLLRTAPGQQAYLAVNPSGVAAASDADTSSYSALQKKVVEEVVTSASEVTQFSTATPVLSSLERGWSGLCRLPGDPSKIDSILDDMQVRPPRSSSNRQRQRRWRNSAGASVPLDQRRGLSWLFRPRRKPKSAIRCCPILPLRQRKSGAGSASSTAVTAGSRWRWWAFPRCARRAGLDSHHRIHFSPSPTGKGIRLSDIEWVGLKNYHQIFTVFHKNFYQALINNTVLMIFLFIFPTALGIVLAYLLDKDLRGTRIYQAVFFTPVVLSLAVVGFMWKSVIYSPDHGLATQLLAGGASHDWLGNQSFLIPFGDQYGVSRNFVAILVAIAWRHTGYIMVLYLAGLKAVDPSLREASLLDGSNEWQTFRHVIFPSLKPVNVVVVVITVIEALRAFDIIYVLDIPRKTEVLSILTTNNLLGEGGGNVGRGSAYATILFILCFGFVIWYVTNHYRNTQEGADS